MERLSGSVGLGGNNRRPDVVNVQTALLGVSISPGPIDGICGRRTIQAIEQFQSNVMRRPDGRIDAGGQTWQRLSQTGGGAAPAATSPFTRNTAPTRSVPIPAQRTAAVARARSAPSPVIAASAATPIAPTGQRAASYWTTKTPLPKSGTVNVGLSSPNSDDQVARFGGMPSAHMSQDDQPVTNPELRALISTESVGPFRVTGIRPAITSLRSVLDEVRRDLPDLLSLLSSAGMEVNRLQRGSTTKVSNHAWGSAIDLRVGGILVPLGASYSLKGLDALVPYFNRAGWYWGGGYRSQGRADPMHFELGGAMMAGVGR